MAIDWLMHKYLDCKRQGIQWTLTSTLEDWDYAHDLSLQTNSHMDIQQNANSLAEYAAMIGLKINTWKTNNKGNMEKINGGKSWRSVNARDRMK